MQTIAPLQSTQRLGPCVRAGRQRLAGALSAAAVFAATGCAGPENFGRQVDLSQAAISRGIGDVVDAADRAFGERRVSDREKIVLVKLGASVETRENSDMELAVPVSLRVPLPALERRANIFLSVDSIADSFKSARAATDALNKKKTVTVALITGFTDAVDAGVRLDVIWDEGPQAGVRPFLRWQWRKDPVRVFAEQQVYERTNQGLGEKTLVQFDWELKRQQAFVRFLTSMEGNRRDPGWNYEHAVIYRRLFPRHELVLSAEAGARHNPYSGDPGADERGAANDTDEGYLQFRATGKVYRPWLEYEVTPAAHVPWHHDDALEFGITFELRFVYESFLRDSRGRQRTAVPSAQPDTGW